MKRKVFHFDTPRAQYRCDAAVVCCFDQRFEMASRKFLKRCGLEMLDLVRIAGGAKALAGAESGGRDFVLDQLRASMRLHAATRAVLMVHSDCGAYGGLDAFGGDAEAEWQHHRQELLRAGANLSAAIPELEIVLYFVDFEGVWAVEK